MEKLAAAKKTKQLKKSQEAEARMKKRRQMESCDEPAGGMKRGGACNSSAPAHC
jgi:hypothetical protein